MKTILLDRVVLKSFYGDSLEGMTEIFSQFLASYPETKKTLIAAYESGNLTSLKRVLQYHAPSFIYLGLPDLLSEFKNLSIKCSEVDSHYSLSNDFKELMLTLESCWQIVKNEMKSLMKADTLIKNV
jgi:hypothetical protein